MTRTFGKYCLILWLASYWFGTVITVGIAYGSDTERATQILERVVKENPDVLEEPKPLITFDMFADSSLNLTVRAFVGAMDKRLPVTHALHTAIDRAFREAGIEIAFPQRDLHLRTLPEAIKLGTFGESREVAPTATLSDEEG